MSQWTRAKFLSEVGKETEIFLRFSTVAGNLGSADAVRDPRGFALKFYTEEGNYDLVGNNTPVFFIKDAIKFPDFIHTQKRDPYTGSQEADNVWDFWGLSPESTHQVTWLFGDRGIPASYRHMNGFGSHTYQWTNEAGEVFWVKYHFKTDQGIKNLTAGEADELAGEDPDSHQRDLRESIERGDFPTWTVQVQVMPAAEAANYRFNPFDLTKVWPHEDYPPIEIGKLELNRNPENIFAEVEQSVFSPRHFVPGIGPSPDKMLQGRLFAYGDAHRYRVGINADHLPVNEPHATEARTYGRDGAMYDGRHGGAKNYEPNSFGGPAETGRPLWEPVAVTGATERPPGARARRGRRLRPGGQPLPADVGGGEAAADRQPRRRHRGGLPRRHRRAGDRELPPGGCRLRQAAGSRGPGPSRLTPAARRMRPEGPDAKGLRSLRHVAAASCGSRRKVHGRTGRTEGPAALRQSPAWRVRGDLGLAGDQFRTMSRTDTTPTGSCSSSTIRWRKPPCVMASAASSRVQVRGGEDDIGGGVGVCGSSSGFWPEPRELRMSRSVRMPSPLVSGSRTTAAPTRRADISWAAWRRVWSGPMVRTRVLIASRTSMGMRVPPPWWSPARFENEFTMFTSGRILMFTCDRAPNKGPHTSGCPRG